MKIYHVLPNPPNLEVIAIKLCLPDKQIFCTVYNPPNLNVRYFEKGMNLFIPKVKVKYKRCPCWLNSENKHTIKRLCSARKRRSSQTEVHSLETYLSQLMVTAKLNFEHNLAFQTSDKIFKHLRGL